MELLLPEYGSYDGGSGGLADIKRSPNTPVERVLPAILDRVLGRMYGVFQQAAREGEAAAEPPEDIQPD